MQHLLLAILQADSLSPVETFFTSVGGASTALVAYHALLQWIKANAKETEAHAAMMNQETRERGALWEKVSSNEKEIERLRTRYHSINNSIQHIVIQNDAMRMALREAGWTEEKINLQFPHIAVESIL
jgi:7-keto-8-aminopelargonate synthetase-like enzyme